MSDSLFSSSLQRHLFLGSSHLVHNYLIDSLYNYKVLIIAGSANEYLVTLLGTRFPGIRIVVLFYFLAMFFFLKSMTPFTEVICCTFPLVFVNICHFFIAWTFQLEKNIPFDFTICTDLNCVCVVSEFNVYWNLQTGHGTNSNTNEWIQFIRFDCTIIGLKHRD